MSTKLVQNKRIYHDIHHNVPNPKHGTNHDTQMDRSHSHVQTTNPHP
jgi:hypothetical protein